MFYSAEALQWAEECKKLKVLLAQSENSVKNLKTLHMQQAEQREQFEQARNKVIEQTNMLKESGKAAEAVKEMQQQLASKEKEGRDPRLGAKRKEA